MPRARGHTEGLPLSGRDALSDPRANPESTISPENGRRYRATRRVTVVGAVVNAFLALAQLLSGWLLNSQALIADGVHTLSDLITDGVVLFAARKAAASPDHDHPYGHGRIETLATVVVGVFLALAGLGIAWAAGQRLVDTDSATAGPAPAALAFAVLTLVAKEGLYQYTHRVAKRIGSRMLDANAWHHRTDAISSLFVLVGVGAAVAGFPWADALAALIVALFILHIAGRLIVRSAAELIDTALDPEDVAHIHRTIMEVPGVKDAHMLRTRRHGNDVVADVHIQVAPMISVSEGHRIADAVYWAVTQRHERLRDFTVHVDPENDEDQARSSNLPLRPEVAEAVREAWADTPELDRLEQLSMHYLNGRIHLTLTLRLDGACTPEDLNARGEGLSQSLQGHPRLKDRLGEVKILYRPCTTGVQQKS
ncbi:MULTISPECIES: cation diffusion facilitator family transporter [unclassified Thioalkalivibrio]|uniref:cation diffusion facilitator family transporter n=1 Tax=unclassified Thioalkalivibrio TaxID=2621013 RepID=UPI000362948D|nr:MULTISPECIES: cation diffusion facilitator family transporter [unclassified Thioalkalivibrio]